MNEQLVNGSPDTGQHVPSDEDGRPLETPVLSMQAPAATLPSGLPDLDLSPRLQSPAAGDHGRLDSPEGREALGVPPTWLSKPHSNSAKPRGQTVMPAGWSLKGDIESSAAVTLGCQVSGRIEITGESGVEIQQGGSVRGVIQGSNVVVRGLVEGEIDAAGGTLSIEDGATIRGKVKYTSIRMSGGEHQMELLHVPRNADTAGSASR